MRFPLLALPRRLRTFGRRALLCLLVLGLGGQGLSQAIERVGAPSHSHRPPPTQALRGAALAAPGPDAVAPARTRDDHRSIPSIGGEPPALDAGRPHDHGGVAAHRHALDDASVVYVDTEDDGSGTAAKPAATACPLLATSPRVDCTAAIGPVAWRAARGWHALALTGEPLDRPPR